MAGEKFDLDEVVCTCTGTSYAKIKTLYEQGFDLDAISSKSGVLSGCGGCEWDVESFIDQLANQKEPSN